MAEKPENTELTPLAVSDTQQVLRIHLCAGAAGIELISSVTRLDRAAPGPLATTIRRTPIGGGPTGNLLTLPQLLPVAPGWDVACPTPDVAAVVYERAGGAANSLGLRDTKSDQVVAVTRQHPMESFSAPRFVRGRGPGLALTALAERAKLVLLEAGADGTFGAYREIQRCAGGLILQTDAGPLLLYKIDLPGSTRDEGVMPGQLHVQTLDTNFKPAGAAQSPLTPTTIFEFDADVAGKEVVVWASTREGCLLLVGAPGRKGLEIAATLSQDHRLPLSSPAVLCAEGEAHVAAIEMVGSEHARVLVGKVKLDRLRK